MPGMANPRVATLILWLNDDYEGGKTWFAPPGPVVRGRIGDALLFRNLGDDGLPDPAARHAGLPVTAGTKIVASRWIRARPAGQDGFGPHEARPRDVSR
ncbi:hypothetical protein ABC347_05500 [Sphingomonas sp. 1P06PA]|uniref:hypothetical protein n=1 Tax=Sphingomonas sp. 1P06PA TaxID=554121 RepID=UPI0039A56884